jgi:hypothetical protein
MTTSTLSQSEKAKESRLRRELARAGQRLCVARGEYPQPARYQIIDDYNCLIAWADTLDDLSRQSEAIKRKRSQAIA